MNTFELEIKGFFTIWREFLLRLIKSFERFQDGSCSFCWLGQHETRLDDLGCPFNSILCLKDSHLKYLYAIPHKWPIVLKKWRENMRSTKRLNFQLVYQNRTQKMGLNSHSFRNPHLASLPVMPELSSHSHWWEIGNFRVSFN